MPKIFQDDKFYEHEPSEQINCGECVTENLKKTSDGTFVGDERVYPHEFRYLEDQDVEAYQCDGCNEQNEAYDSVLDDD